MKALITVTGVMLLGGAGTCLALDQSICAPGEVRYHPGGQLKSCNLKDDISITGVKCKQYALVRPERCRAASPAIFTITATSPATSTARSACTRTANWQPAPFPRRSTSTASNARCSRRSPSLPTGSSSPAAPRIDQSAGFTAAQAPSDTLLSRYR